jgi:hypothetical protein
MLNAPKEDVSQFVSHTSCPGLHISYIAILGLSI